MVDIDKLTILLLSSDPRNHILALELANYDKLTLCRAIYRIFKYEMLEVETTDPDHWYPYYLRVRWKFLTEFNIVIKIIKSFSPSKGENFSYGIISVYPFF